MTQWYVKELSKITGITVQTLHHYDRINLLKPSLRLPNGYRLYSEKDLFRLQQIIALKFFGFELAQINKLLVDNVDTIEHFTAQANFLEQKAKSLLEASSALKGITAEYCSNKSIPWETIIQVMEVYTMTQKLEHAWVKEIFNADELKQYLAFEAEMKTNSSIKQEDFEKNWHLLLTEIEDNLQQDPTSEIGVRLGEKCMQLVNSLYGKKYAHLRTKKFEKGFGEGKGLAETGLTSQTVSWLDKAVDAYWRKRIYHTLNLVGSKPSLDVAKLWNELMDEMYGEDEARKAEIINVVLNDDSISTDIKKWLQNL